MFCDKRDQQHQGELPLEKLIELCKGYPALRQTYDSPVDTLIITRGAHHGTWYPGDPPTDYYFDFQIQKGGSQPAGECHALLVGDAVKRLEPDPFH